MKRRIFTSVLILMLFISLMPMGASAGSMDDVKQYGEVDGSGYGGYLAFGDSITRGCGATEDYMEAYYDYTDRTVENSYPLIIAQAVGCNIVDDARDTTSNYWPICYPGQTLAATMDMLGIEDFFYDEEYTHNTNKGHDTYNNHYNGVTSVYGDIVEKVKKASLITIELGMSDVINRSAVLLGNGDGAIDMVKRFVKSLYSGYSYWCEYYPVLLEQLIEWNPNAEIVIVSAFNPVSNVKLTDSSLVKIGNIITGLTDSMNVKYKSWAKKYGCTFVDITNTDSAAAEFDWAIVDDEFSINSRVSSHPSPNGYQYIARQILAELPTEDGTETASFSRDIVVDLGRFQSVSMVTLDGIPIKNYELNGSVLTIHAKLIVHRNLTVYVLGEDYKIATATYKLTFNGRYSPYRIYVSNEIMPIVRKGVLYMMSLGKK